jgi:hypothetical protein
MSERKGPPSFRRALLFLGMLRGAVAAGGMSTALRGHAKDSSAREFPKHTQRSTLLRRWRFSGSERRSGALTEGCLLGIV